MELVLGIDDWPLFQAARSKSRSTSEPDGKGKSGGQFGKRRGRGSSADEFP